MKCKKCGSEIPSGASFCTKCGEKVDTPKRDTKFCIKCGNEIPLDANVCTKCGASQGKDSCSKEKGNDLGLNLSSDKKNKLITYGLIAIVGIVMLVVLFGFLSCLFGGGRFNAKHAEELVEEMFDGINDLDYEKLDEITYASARQFCDSVLEDYRSMDYDDYRKAVNDGDLGLKYSIKANKKTFRFRGEKTKAACDFVISVAKGYTIELQDRNMRFDFREIDGRWMITEVYFLR